MTSFDSGAIRAAASSVTDYVTTMRRQIHRYPELAYEEHRTSALVEQELTSLGLELHRGMAGTGTVALLHGSAKPSTHKTILLRADIDALPVEEKSGVSFTSQQPGVMHACGHDAHTAMLLGCARVLSQVADELPGTVAFMFQPAEEGGLGAARMLQDGLLKLVQPDIAYAIHVWPESKTGKVGLRAGPLMAGMIQFAIEIVGTEGHAARPHHTVDPVVVAAQIVGALQVLISRETNPFEPAALTIGSMVAGTSPGVVPGSAIVRGSVRAHSQAALTGLEQRIEEMASNVARAMRARASYTALVRYPPLVNDAAAVEIADRAIRSTLGDDAIETAELSLGSEDFALILSEVPGALVRLGVGNHDAATPFYLHSPEFILDEDALTYGVQVLTSLAVGFFDAAVPDL